MGKVIRCRSLFIQAKEKVKRVVSIPLPRAKELLPPDIATLTSLRDKDTSEELSEQFFTILEEAAPSSKSISETPTNTKRKPSIS